MKKCINCFVLLKDLLQEHCSRSLHFYEFCPLTRDIANYNKRRTRTKNLTITAIMKLEP